MKEIIKTLQKLADIAELKGAKIFYKALSKQYRDVIMYVNKYGLDAAIRDLDRLVKEEYITEAMTKYYEVAALPSAVYQYKLLKEGEKALGSDIRSALSRWLQQITEYIITSVGTQIARINETTREGIRRTLADAKGQGLGARAAGRLLEEQNGINKSRSLLIARTEGTRAASQAAKIASDRWKQETGKRRFKRWVSIIDDRTRHDHEEADGQIVEDSLKFEIGSTGMEFPGDENAPPSEVCNCRCRVLYMSERMMLRLRQSLAA